MMTVAAVENSYYRARYYDPSPGRFISEDLVDFEEGVNFYAYVENHVTDFVDSDGMGKRRPRHLPNDPQIRCTKFDTCKQLYWKMWAFNWLIDSHIGFDLRAQLHRKTPSRRHTGLLERPPELQTYT